MRYVPIVNPGLHLITNAKQVLWLGLFGLFNCAPEPPPEPVPDARSQHLRSVWESTDQAIAWGHWTANSFAGARRDDLPVLLYLSAPGCDGIFSRNLLSVRSLVEERFVAIHVDPFLRPDIARRYASGGWPALVIMTPDARAFSMVVDIPPGNVELFLLRILEGYQKQKGIIERNQGKGQVAPLQRDAIEVSVGATHEAVVAAFDSVYGGFGRGAKLIEVELLRFLLEHYIDSQDSTSLQIVQKSLDALLDSPMRDSLEGGFFAYSHTPDWQTPVQEKDLIDQAGLVQVLLRAAQYDNPEYARAARDLIAQIVSQFYDPKHGAFRGRKVRMESGGWWTDPAIYADRNALLISAFAAAVRDLGDERAALMANRAMKYLMDHCIDPEGAVNYQCTDEKRETAGLLEGQVLVSLALLDLYELSGEEEFRERAQQTMGFMEEHLFDPEAEAFFDRPESAELAGLARHKLTPYNNDMLTAGNVLAAELYTRLNDQLRAGALLRGNRPLEASGLSASSYARVLLQYGRVCRKSL